MVMVPAVLPPGPRSPFLPQKLRLKPCRQISRLDCSVVPWNRTRSTARLRHAFSMLAFFSWYCL